MKILEKKPSRSFIVGKNKDIKIEDCGSIKLDNNEHITFLTNDKKEWDILKKDWGYYATPSINDRLRKQGFRCALVKNKRGSTYIILIEQNKINQFDSYISHEENHVVMWLDEL